ncbi:hypothetical protein AB0D57_45890 [Streptomyces sp. NPDC048275]|uniref:hypothetical protein n=1 Tax=Streptomyces sp. NPDC048275 TaxID=3155629 RepID=UPI0033E0AA60
MTDNLAQPMTLTTSTSTSPPAHASLVTCEIRMETTHWAYHREREHQRLYPTPDQHHYQLTA